MARIFYFTLQDEQTKDEKLDWFANTKIEQIPFEQITPDKKANWVNQTDNDFDDLLPLVDKDVKAGKSEEAIFQLFSRGVATQRDEWVYDFSSEVLIDKVKYLVDGYMEQLIKGTIREFDIKWDAETTQYIKRKISKKFNSSQIVKSVYRPYTKQYLYLDKHFNGRTYQWFNIFRNTEINQYISISGIGSSKTFQALISQEVVCLDFLEKTQCLPLYRYDEKGDRVENITDWALERFRERYQPSPPAPLPQERGARLEQEIEPDLVRLVGARRDIPEVLLQKAKELRQKQTPAEQMLWQCLRANQLHGAKFRRQHNIGQYIVDFYCHTAKLVIELDGGIHELQKDRDSDRDTYLKANGLQVLRFQNEEITQNLPQVLQTITNHLFLFLPSPAGEGQGVRAETLATEEVRLETPASILSPSPAGEGLGVRAETPATEEIRAETSTQKAITKLDIFHYTYAVLHHPAYRTKYELNLKREFPRLPFYEDFHQWASWGKALMDLHLNYETIEPYGLQRVEIATKDIPKAKLKADKTNGVISLDDNTQLTDVPAIAWEYKLGNRSALEWILDQYKEKKPKDPTIAKLFNTYKFADYKEQVIDLLQRVCTVSVKTMEIIQLM
ncbi:helicase domain protein [Pseudanabaena sp. ABRG5-3]|nr:type ISP restriction/modification enzyme [Pseudanabaena sp. ABRG5-3]BBC23928.1 helicase domain protein [Pseudanabaena sp. ABRG5-3]